MPDRILRSGILTSDAVNALSGPAELFYRRLMSAVDDFGRFDARPSILRAACFPLRMDKVREADILRWLTECETAELIALYAVDAKPYLLMAKVGRPRAEKSKYPAPPPEVEKRMLSRARTCAHVRAGVTGSYSDSNAHSDSYSGSVAASPPAVVKPKREPSGDQQRAIDFWLARWAKTYRRDHPRISGRDAKHVKDLLERIGLDETTAAMGRYLDCGDAFLNGHPIGMLASQLTKFMVERKPSADRSPAQKSRAAGQFAQPARPLPILGGSRPAADRPGGGPNAPSAGGPAAPGGGAARDALAG